ncbi:MAG: hypothetical protein D6780_05910, partial [Candidatus Dadabacteria bacterium]
MSQDNKEKNQVTLKIDGKEVTVDRGTPIIEAAKKLGIEIPYYCYHPCLSVPGNCRMCQVEVAGAPKLMISCHTVVQDGMEVKTHLTSDKVKEAQASVLEFLLINHPLDCTVCDQAGHCKLQDYHFEYNAKGSRFIEEKEHKPKAVELGPTVMLDAERCIACTRCIRFCDEVPKTGELGLVNRSDKYTIAVKEGHELNNPFSGTVVDLCPVGALTHKKWRFNTRIWYANSADTICPGCSTGCNVKVYVRDNKVVQVKARLNLEVNKEWLCDEGRYGLEEFLPEERIYGAKRGEEEISLDSALKELKALLKDKTALFLSSDLLYEDFYLIKKLIDKTANNDLKVVLGYKKRELTEVEKILISPDRAPNFKGALRAGVVKEEELSNYERFVKDLSAFKCVVVLGDKAIEKDDMERFLAQIKDKETFFLGSDALNPLAKECRTVVGVTTVLERSGIYINNKGRAQYLEKANDAEEGILNTREILQNLLEAWGEKLSFNSDRELTL